MSHTLAPIHSKTGPKTQNVAIKHTRVSKDRVFQTFLPSLLTNQEVAIRISVLLWDFYLVENYSTVCTVWICPNSVSFVHVLYCIVFGGGFYSVLTKGYGRSSSWDLYVVHRNFLECKIFATKSGQ